MNPSEHLLPQPEHLQTSGSAPVFGFLCVHVIVSSPLCGKDELP